MKLLLKLLKFVFVLILILVLLIAAALAYFNYSSSGQQQLANLINDKASNENQTIEISAIKGLLSGTTHFDNLTVTDNRSERNIVSLQNTTINWNPWDLLSGQLSIEKLHVVSTQLSKPETSAKEPSTSGGFSLNDLPIELNLKQWQLDDIVLDPSITGTTATLTANGSLALEVDRLALVADISRKDAIEGTIKANINYSPADNIFELDVSADEPKEGLLGFFLKAPKDTAIKLTVNGQGNIDLWQGGLELTMDQDKAINLIVKQSKAGTDNNHLLEVKGVTHLAPLAQGRIPAGLVGLPEILRGDTNVNLVSFIDPLALSFNQLNAELINPNWALSAAGDYDQDNALLQSTLKAATGRPLTLSQQQHSASVQALNLTVAKVKDEIDAKVAISVSQLRSGDNQFTNVNTEIQLDKANIDNQSFIADINGAVEKIELAGLKDPALNHLLSLPTKLSGKFNYNDSVITAESLSVNNNDLDLLVSGNYNLTQKNFVADLDSTLTTTFLAEIPKYRKLSEIGPKLSIKSDISGTLAGTDKQHDQTGSVTLLINNIELQSDELTLKGSGEIDSNLINLNISSDFADAKILSDKLQGPLSLDTTAIGKLSDIQIQSDIKSSQLLLQGQPLGQIEGSINAKITDSVVEGALGVTAFHRGEQLALSTLVAQSEPNSSTLWQLDDLKFDFSKNSLVGDLVINKDFSPSGEFDFTFPNIKAMGSLFGQDITGNASGKVELTNNTPPTINVTFRGNNIITPQVNISSAAGDIRINNWRENPTLEGNIEIPSVTSGNEELNNLRLDLKTSDKNVAVNATLIYDNETIVINGKLFDDNGNKVLLLNDFQGNIKGIPVALGQPINFALDQGIQFSELALQLAGGSIESSGQLSADSSIATKLNSIDISELTATIPELEVTGKLSGEVTVSGKSSDPNILFDLELTNFNTKRTQDNGIEDLTITAKGSLRDKVVQIDAHIVNQEGLALKADGSINLETLLSDLALTGKFPLKLLAVQLAKNDISVKGNLQLDVTAKGSLLEPDLLGTISSSDISLYDGHSGITFAPISIDSALQGKTLSVKKVVAPLSTGGRLIGTGELIVDDEGKLPIKSSLEFIRTNFTDGEIVDTVINGKITLSGELLGNLAIQGQLELGETNISVPEATPSSVSQIDVKHKNAPEKIIQQWEQVRQKTAKTKSKPIDLNIGIKANNRIFIRGRGIDAELSGEVRVKGSSSKPTTEGALKLTRGRITILEKRLDLTDGTVNFFGTLMPQLDLTAMRQGKNAEITVKVTGPANDPEILFSSVPDLPQDEIVAQLLFARSLDQLSPLQYAQLADAIAKLTGSSNGLGLNITNNIRDAVDVDDIDLKTNPETGEVSVVVGKYLNDRTYVTVEQGGSVESGKATIDLSIGRGVKLHGEAIQTGETKLGVYYEKEY